MKKILIASVLLVAPFLVQAQTVACPVGYTCIPISTQSYDNGYYYGGGYYSHPTTTTIPPSSSPTTITPVNPTIPAVVVPPPVLNAPCPTITGDLTLGSYGPVVSSLQLWLISRGFNIPAISSGAQQPGFFSYQTAAAVGQFQSSIGVPATGYVGPQTRSAIAGICVGATTNNPTTPTTPTTQAFSVTMPTSLTKGQTYTINWTSTGAPVSYYTVYLSGGSIGANSPRVVGTSYSRADGRAGVFSWTVPTDVADGSNYRLQFGGASTPGGESSMFAIVGSTTQVPTTPNTDTGQPLSVVCTGTPSQTAGNALSWVAQAAGGQTPYSYSWSMYNDVLRYVDGNGATASYLVSYQNTGAKQAAIKVTDGVSRTAYATCVGNVPVVSTTPVPPTTPTNPTTPQAIFGSITPSTFCAAPGAPITFTVRTSGTGITSRTVEKDTNSDGIFGEVASWGAGVGTNTYVTNEASTYSGTYSFRLLINGQVRDSVNVTVSSQCAPVTTPTNPTTPTPPPTPTNSLPLTATCSATPSSTVGYGLNWNATVSGGTAPYFYYWALYNDYTQIGSGSTRSQALSAVYKTSGLKEAYFTVIDYTGKPMPASCTGTVQAVTPPPPTTTLSSPIAATITTPSACVTPGTPMTFQISVTGSGINTKTLEKDTNSDGVFGEVASWGPTAGVNVYTSNEPASYSGFYDLRVMVNGVEKARKEVTVNSGCGTSAGGTGQTYETGSVTPNTSVVNSGIPVTVNFAYPANTIGSQMYVACPSGVTAVRYGGVDVCNRYIDIGMGQSYQLMMTNNTTADQSVQVNMQIFTSDNPSFAKGVSSGITVHPIYR